MSQDTSSILKICRSQALKRYVLIHDTEMPRDILADSLAVLRIVEHDEDQCPLDDSPKSRNDSPKSRQSSCENQAFRSNACYYNYGVNEGGSNKRNEGNPSGKANSLPPNSTIKLPIDEIVLSALRVSPEDIANQLTLLDLPCFQSIQANELTSCAWNKRNKLTAAPNVVAFTRRFNQVSFWTVQEILNAKTPKARAEVIAHFVKIAKKLHDLNNIHSLFAVISALQSVSVFRLSKSWLCLSKKDKLLFDKLAELFVEQHNWTILREYLRSLSLPCIPYLGIFLTDLVYIDIAHPAGSQHRVSKMSIVLECIATYQKSEYIQLIPLPRVQSYLRSVRYIEELQKFLEDDQYKLSLKLEPPSPIGSSTGSKESVKGWEATPLPSTSNTFSLSPSHRPISGSLRLPASLNPPKFKPGHRKCRSLGSKFRSTSLPRNFHKVAGLGGGGTLIKNYATDNKSETTANMGSVNLLDDTFLESPVSLQAVLNPNILQNGISVLKDSNVGYQGFVKRKTVLKDGRKPPLTTWQRYWLQIWASSLIYFSPKSFSGSTRSDYKSEPCKMTLLEGWVAVWVEGDSSDMFQLLNNNTSCLYKFRTGSVESAKLWVTKIQEVTNKPVVPLPANLMSFE